MDTTVKKIDRDASPHGAMGQTYLASGKKLSMRLWEDEAPTAGKTPRARPYETIGIEATAPPARVGERDAPAD